METGWTIEYTEGIDWYTFLELIEILHDDPLPEPWLQTGQICATVANTFRGKGKRAISPRMFMPKRRRKKMTGAEMMAAVASTGRVVPRGKGVPGADRRRD
jgi:hypothetical protein